MLQLPFFAIDNLKTPSTQESRAKLSRDHSLKSPTANSQVMSILNKDRSSSTSNGGGFGKMPLPMGNDDVDTEVDVGRIPAIKNQFSGASKQLA